MRKKYHIWISIFGCGILGALLIGNQLEQTHPEAGSILVVIIFAAFIYLNLTQQCPKCGKSLTNRVWKLREKKIIIGKRITMPRHCPACGKQIDQKTANQRLEAIVKTPVESGKVYVTATHLKRWHQIKKGIKMKTKISSITIALLVSLCFQGCKSTDLSAEENFISSLEIGKGTKQDALNIFGKPHNKSVDENGYEHWVYDFNTPKENYPSEAKLEKLELIYDGEILKDTFSILFDPTLAGTPLEGHPIITPSIK